MNDVIDTKRKSYLEVLRNKCPRCRTGRLFVARNAYRLKDFMKMHAHCPACGQQTEIEVGFYFGAHYVSYALAVALSGVTFVAWLVLIGFSFQDNRFFYWIGVNGLILILAQPYLQRLSRTIWLSFFVKYEKDWRTKPPEKGERINEDMINIW